MKDFAAIFNGLSKIADKHGFKATKTTSTLNVMARNTDGDWIFWIKYDYSKDTLYFGDTDYLNIWLCDTRPDLTDKQIIDFIQELNNAYGFKGDEKIKVKELISPEDWQEIAKVSDASNDKRYAEN